MRKTLMSLLLATRIKKLDVLASVYQRVTDPEEIAALQVARFNAHWQHAWSSVPFYMSWRKRHALPKRITCLRELHAFPVLTKAVLSDEWDLVARSPGRKRFTLTGGTSGISTAFPMNSADADTAWINTHLGRSWSGIRPHDRLFMIWGHSHLFSGKGASLKQAKRQIKDRLNNTRRVSAYNLDESQLRFIAQELARFRPRYVIGYGSCLVQFCRYMRAEGWALRDLGIRRIVNTSETLEPSDASLVTEVFRCPVINEYGMAEAGVVGYSCEDLYPLRIFWHDFVLATHQRRLMITTLGSRCFPLINYDSEDICDAETPGTGALLNLSNLLGKARDIFVIRDVRGQPHEVSVILFDHILKQIDSLRSLHYELDSNGDVHIRYTAEGGQLEQERLRSRFALGLKQEGIEIDPNDVGFTWLSQPLQTVAGKRQTLVRRA